MNLMSLSQWFASFLQLFVISSPPSAIPVLLALTASQSPRQRIGTAATACAVAAGILVCFAFAGQGIFRFFGISLQAFKIAGGAYLLFVGISLANEKNTDDRPAAREKAPSGASVAITPLGIPLLCGPGMISTTLLFGGNAPSLAGKVCLSLSVLSALGLLFVLLWLAVVFSQKISTFALKLASRLIGFCIAAMGFLILSSGVVLFLERGSAL
jgi:multiple antibiotic resistance protein